MNGMMRAHTQDVIRLATLIGMHLSLDNEQYGDFSSECKANDIDPATIFYPSAGVWKFSTLGMFLLKVCAKVHDIGKPFFRHSYSLERDLDQDEYEIQKLHANLTRILIKSWLLSEEYSFQSEKLVTFVADMAAGHQERFDGKGYPDGRSGKSIGLISRILAPLDAISAMMNTRPFRDPCSMGQCIKELMRSSGTQFDGDILDKTVAVLKSDPETPARMASENKPCERFSADFLKFIQLIDFAKVQMEKGDRSRISELEEVVGLALAHQRAIRHQSVH